MADRRRIKDFVISHPGTDLIMLVLAPLTSLWAQRAGFTVDSPHDLLMGTSTVGALVLASGSFAATMVYGSTVDFMVIARRRFHRELARNWRSILGWCFTATVAPLLAMFAPSIAVPTALSCIAMLGTKFVRSLFWFQYTLTLDVASASTPRLHEMRPADDLARRRKG